MRCRILLIQVAVISKVSIEFRKSLLLDSIKRLHIYNNQLFTELSVGAILLALLSNMLRINMMIRFVTAAVAALFSLFTLAQDTTSTDFNSWRISVDSLSLDSNKTIQEGLADSTTGIGLGLDFRKGLIVGGFGMYAGSIDDENGFSQAVEDQFGNQSVADSTTSVLSFYGEAGASYLVAGLAYLEIVGGFQSLSITRSISNCSDCDSEDMDLSGGVYVKPRVRVPFGEKFMGSLSLMSYLSGDIKSAFALGFEGRF